MSTRQENGAHCASWKAAGSCDLLLLLFSASSITGAFCCTGALCSCAAGAGGGGLLITAVATGSEALAIGKTAATVFAAAADTSLAGCDST